MPTPPRSVPRAAFFLWLARRSPAVLKADLLALVEASALPAQAKLEARIRLEEAAEFHRDDPLVAFFAPALGLSDAAALDAAFIDAVSIS